MLLIFICNVQNETWNVCIIDLGPIFLSEMAFEITIPGSQTIPTTGLMIRIPNNLLRIYLKKEDEAQQVPIVGREVDLLSNEKCNEKCASCSSGFEKRKDTGNARRYSLKSHGMEESKFATNGDFICTSCHLKFKRDKTAREKAPSKTSNRSFSTETTCAEPTLPVPLDHDYIEILPAIPQQNRICAIQKPKISTDELKASIMTAIARGAYAKAMKIMLESKNHHVKRAVRQSVERAVLKESRQVKSTKSLYRKAFSPKLLNTFCWGKENAKIKELMPLTYAVIASAMPNAKTVSVRATVGRKKRKRKLDLQKSNERVDMKIGTVISIILYNMYPRKFAFIPAAISSHLKLNGVAQDVIKYLNRVGLTLGVKGTSTALKKAQQEFDQSVLKWKEDLAQIKDDRMNYNLRTGPRFIGKLI